MRYLSLRWQLSRGLFTSQLLEGKTVVHHAPDLPVEKTETLYTLITARATRASDRDLTILLCVALVSSAALLAALPALWPISALAGTFATIASWGLLAHRTPAHPSSVFILAQRLLVVLGSFLALFAGLAIFFSLLGPRWML